MSIDEFYWPGFDDANPVHSALHGFLVLDVQYSSHHTKSLLERLRAYRTGKIPSYEGSGNGYYFAFRPEGVLLEPLYAGEGVAPVIVPFGLFQEALVAWDKYCRIRIA
jgi:hypothetical protein